jgi:hypothetical protein
MRVCTAASPCPPLASPCSRNQPPRWSPRNACACSCSSERTRAGIWPSRPFPFCPTNVPLPPPPPLWIRQSCFQFFFSLHNASVYGPKRMESGGEAQRARSMENDTIVVGNSGPSNVFISGATGPNAARINGHYVPTQETGLDGRILYLKSDCLHVCIEHRTKTNCSGVRSFTQAGDSVWQVKYVWSKGTDQCFAGVEGGCALEACVSRIWRVGMSNEFHEQPNVNMRTGAAARRAVTGPLSNTFALNFHPLLPPCPHFEEPFYFPNSHDDDGISCSWSSSALPKRAQSPRTTQMPLPSSSAELQVVSRRGSTGHMRQHMSEGRMDA